MNKKILDACCGGRMFWFDKAHPDALYIDIREEQDYQTGKGKDNRHRAIKPDKVMDFRKMDLPNNSVKYWDSEKTGSTKSLIESKRA